MHSPKSAPKFAEIQGPLPRGWDEGDRYIAEAAWPRLLPATMPRATSIDDCACLTCLGTGTIAKFHFDACYSCDGTGFKAYLVHAPGA